VSSSTPIPFSKDGVSGSVVVVAAVVAVLDDDVEVAAVVSTGARVVISDVVVASSSPPQETARTARTIMRARVLSVLTESECIRAGETTSMATPGTVRRMDDLTGFVAAELAERADADRAARMAAYMKTDMPFYGVQKKPLTEIYRETKRRFPIEDSETYRRAVLALWNRPHREEKYLAISIARYNTRFVTYDHIDLYRKLIVEGAWWDFVDDVAVNCVGVVHLNERRRMEPVIEAWIDDDFMWLRRTALISPLKHKEQTDYETLFGHCLRRAHEKEFFIRKAIGWTLRQYARTEPERVRGFLLEHRERWSGLTFREAAKHLDIL
jgi:3-methyladenine DNA glycosylase AlkD